VQASNPLIRLCTPCYHPLVTSQMQEDLYPRWFNNLPGKTRSAHSAETNPYPRLLAWLTFAFLLFLFLNSLWTWFSIAILADEATIKGYLQEVAGPESSTSAAATSNQAFIQEVATSSLQTALFTFLVTTALFFTWLKVKSKKAW
jgi:hypothetical protein